MQPVNLINKNDCPSALEKHARSVILAAMTLNAPKLQDSTILMQAEKTKLLDTVHLNADNPAHHPLDASQIVDISATTQKPPDPRFTELIDNYKNLLRSRAIPYPVTYQFVRELGHGRQGVVFLASRHGARGCITHYAIKLFDPSIYSGAARYWTDMGRIARQVSLLQPINSVNLVSCDFYEECNGIGYMHMQAIDGVDLHFLLNNKHMDMARPRSTPAEWERFMTVLFRYENGQLSLRTGAALHILRNILRGLAVLHNKGFIHGDIKPTNIMIDVQGTIKLVDFGRAGRIGEPINILLGSPLYMAPELHRREPGMAQSDIFSTGMLALEILQGRQITKLADYTENNLLDLKTTLSGQLERWLPDEVLRNIELTRVLKQFLEPDIANRAAGARQAEIGEHSLFSSRQWLSDTERESEYERELEAYLHKLVDEETGKLNPHFGSDNLTAVIEV